jgi:hypothetical protein
MHALVLAVALAACTDVDLSGIYRVDMQVGAAPCGTDTPLVGRPPFLKFHKDRFITQDYFAYDGCMDAAATMCNPIGGLFSGFSEPIDNGWRGVVSTSSSSGATCTFHYLEQSATLAGIQLSIESHDFSQTVDLPSAQCTADEAGKRGASMPCAVHEHISATKL